jgi:hypothetical protein
MKKNILSMSIIAVLAAVTSSSVMGFDTDGTSASANDGPILVQGKTDLAGYQGNLLPLSGTTPLTANTHLPLPSAGTLALSANGRGDALVFPLFSQMDDWGTEIVVRNTDQNHAIVAKVAVYAKDDSRELLDFNVYLSASDVVRFKIENGNLTSEDGSILRNFPAPSSNIDDVDDDDFASSAKPFSRVLSEDSGYIVVYGMAQASTDADPADSHSQRYHKQHPRLFANYRRDLDVCRPGWRIGHLNAMDTGTYIRRTTNSSVDNYSVAAPNQAEDCATGAGSTAVAGNFFGDVDASLTGTVRLYNAVNGARDMMLPAKAIANFTSDNKIIYSEGEIGALQDRQIMGAEWEDHDNDANTPDVLTDSGWAMYSEAAVRLDATAFLVNNTTYTFAASSVANKLIITQPYKRPLVQLGNDDGYWQDIDLPDDFGGFSFIYNVFNEHEEMDNISYTHSPHNSGITVFRNEVESMDNLEENTEFDGKNGYALVRFTNVGGQNSGIPVVVTQMIGTTVGGAPQLNWIYSQTN